MKHLPTLSFAACLLVACVSTPVPPPQPWTELTVSGIRVQVRPATRDILEQRFGSPPGEMNPLLDFPAILTGQKILVLETRIDSPEHVLQVVTNKTTLAFEGAKPGFLSPVEARALDQKALQDAWLPYVDGTAQVPDLASKSREALPGDLKAGPGTPASGYLVFLHNFPKSGVAILSLTLRASNGDEDLVEVRIPIGEAGKGASSTGIFAAEGQKQ